MNGIAAIERPYWREKKICRSLEKLNKEYLWGTEEWILSSCQEGMEQIPVMVKIIRAQKPLSIQVHPDDLYAKAFEKSPGKTEMWYILDCKKDAYLYYGFKHKITREELKKRIRNQTLTEVCKKVSVKKGDVYFVPAGMLHAIGGGITLAEVQQNSNLTYRLFDYGRMDENNRPRILHLAKAMDVLGCQPAFFGKHPLGPRVEREGGYETLLASCPYFSVLRLEIEGRRILKRKGEFHFLYLVDGEITVHYEKEEICLSQEDNLFLCGENRQYTLEGTGEVLLIKA